MKKKKYQKISVTVRDIEWGLMGSRQYPTYIQTDVGTFPVSTGDLLSLLENRRGLPQTIVLEASDDGIFFINY